MLCIWLLYPDKSTVVTIYSDEISSLILYFNAMFQLNYDNDSLLSLSLSQQVTWWATTRHLDGTPHLQW